MDINKNPLCRKEIYAMVGIMEKYKAQILSLKDNMELEEIIMHMIEEIRENCVYSNVNGLNYYIISTVKDLIQFNKEFEGYFIDYEKLEAVVRDFKDTEYNYDDFEKKIMKSMRYIDSVYKERNSDNQ